MGFNYTRFYPGGWKNRPDTSTPITHDALDAFDAALTTLNAAVRQDTQTVDVRDWGVVGDGASRPLSSTGGGGFTTLAAAQAVYPAAVALTDEL
jgi:hypothetical protein